VALKADTAGFQTCIIAPELFTSKNGEEEELLLLLLLLKVWGEEVGGEGCLTGRSPASSPIPLLKVGVDAASPNRCKEEEIVGREERSELEVVRFREDLLCRVREREGPPVGVVGRRDEAEAMG